MYTKSFFICFLLTTSYSTATLQFNSRGITDDSIVEAMRSPKPPSVSKLINLLEKRSDEELKKITQISLSDNNITVEGAYKILRFINTKIPTLEKLDLSCNQIRDWRGSAEYENFESSLVTLLGKDTFLKIKFKTNPIASTSWLQYMKSEYGKEIYKKIDCGLKSKDRLYSLQQHRDY